MINVHIRNKFVDYKFNLWQKYNLLTGDSGEGKTTLYKMIASYDENKQNIQCLGYKKLGTDLTLLRTLADIAMEDDDKVKEDLIHRLDGFLIILDENSSLLKRRSAPSLLERFNRLLVEEIAKMTYNSLAIMVFSFFVALILNQKFKGRAFVRAVFFLPVILSSGVILGIESDNSLLASVQDAIQDSIGTASITDTIQNILVTSGVGIKAFEKVFEIVDGVYDVAIASGIQIIIFLSGLQTISTSMYEAASLEGCTKWECLWKVTFPMISSLFLVNWVYTIIDFCMRSDNEVMEKISNTMIVDMNYGFASSMAWIYFMIVIAIVGISSLIISKGVYYYE